MGQRRGQDDCVRFDIPLREIPDLLSVDRDNLTADRQTDATSIPHRGLKTQALIRQLTAGDSVTRRPQSLLCLIICWLTSDQSPRWNASLVCQRPLTT
jgi:hypothetical protein